MARFGLALALAVAAGAAAASETDAYLAGYVAAIVERDFQLEVVRCDVSAGTARVEVRDLAGIPPEQLAEAIERVDGIERSLVSVASEEEAGPPETGAAPVDESTPPAAGADAGERGVELLPRKELFAPLLADPRQPRFSLAALWYIQDPELNHVGSATLGETFAILGGPLGRETRWEVGLLGGVFSIFDLDASSADLVNSDYLGGITASLRRGRLSGQLRVYHQSSHLGDEFLLRNSVERQNLSYEGVELLTSADLHSAVRVYVGGGAIVRDEPDLAPWSAQAGLELQSPVAFFGFLRPVAAADIQFRQENDWREEVSANAGLQLENPDVSPVRLQILGTYFRGNSPNGQFFERRIEYLGVGAQLQF